MIKCDVDKMQRVFDNLLRNAVNYSFDNSTIHIVAAQKENVLSIKFTNCGNTIPKEKLERVFEEYPEALLKREADLDLRPALSLKARVVLLRAIKKGESVGYGRAFVAARDSIIAMLSIGYADGFPRNLSYGKGYVLIHGHKAPVVGRICMDQLAVDVTDIPGVGAGVIATLIGKNGEEEIAAPMVAENS